MVHDDLTHSLDKNKCHHQNVLVNCIIFFRFYYNMTAKVLIYF